MPVGKGKAFRKPSSVPIQEATAFLVISEKAITMTGISGSDLLIGKATKKAGSKESRGKQSIYRCQHCGYISEQKAQGATDVHSEHLGHCLQCRLCDYRTFCSMDFKPHLINKHPGCSSEWFEPLPDLSHIAATEVEPKDIIIGVKEETQMTPTLSQIQILTKRNPKHTQWPLGALAKTLCIVQILAFLLPASFWLLGTTQRPCTACTLHHEYPYHHL